MCLADRSKIEADLWMVIDGAIIIGEAKRGGTLGSTAAARKRVAQRYPTLAQLLTADRVVFASDAEWQTTSRNAVDSAFARSSIVPEFIRVGDRN